MIFRGQTENAKKTLSFVKELKNVTKEAGDSLRLKCDVTGTVPATSIIWFKNDGPVLEEQNRVITSFASYCLT